MNIRTMQKQFGRGNRLNGFRSGSYPIPFMVTLTFPGVLSKMKVAALSL
jgi:hypothetical protein